MRIAVIGAGYVGLVTGACLADFGHWATCVDLNEAKIAALNAGALPIFEPGLSELVSRNVADGRLAFSTEVAAAVRSAQVVFIAVGTPPRAEDGHADISNVYSAAREVAFAVRDYTVIVTKSTVPVGTGDELANIVREANPTADISVVSNPEFLREGAAIEDFKRPDRIVIGAEDNRAREVMAEVYRPLLLIPSPLMFVSRRTAELTKYAANGFLALKITFINEIADLCEATGADVQDLARGIGLDSRIGLKFLSAGPGYGGSCFPKDTMALIKSAQDYERPLRLIETTVSVNESRKRSMGRRVIAACGGNVRGKTIAILGLTFKPDTDDLRESPAIAIIRVLQDGGATVKAFDPEGMKGAPAVFANVTYGTDAYDTALDAQALVIVTEWDAFRALDFARLKNTMRAPVLVDLRNIYRREEVERHGFAYSCVGRPAKRAGADPIDDDAELRTVRRERLAAPRLVRPTA
jgi:UDPglucose 6-dehydrogenase